MLFEYKGAWLTPKQADAKMTTNSRGGTDRMTYLFSFYNEPRQEKGVIDASDAHFPGQTLA